MSVVILKDEKPGLEPETPGLSLPMAAGDSPVVGDPSPTPTGPSSSGRIPGRDPGEGGSTPPGPSIDDSSIVQEFLAGYNVSDDGGAYVILAPAFFQGKSTVFAERVKDFSQVLWDVRSGKIKPSRSKQTT